MVPDDYTDSSGESAKPGNGGAKAHGNGGNGEAFAVKPAWNWEAIREHFHLPKYDHDHPPVKNANELASERLSVMDKFAVAITDKVGSFGFFLIIFCWTILWTGYNIIASEVPALHWKAFDPFPAFVAYLLISNVIQILLMPLIMVGQNLQNRHTEIRSELDFEINRKAEQEVAFLMRHMERNTTLLLHLMKHMDCRITEEELRAIQTENELAARLAAMGPKGKE